MLCTCGFENKCDEDEVCEGYHDDEESHSTGTGWDNGAVDAVQLC